MFHVGQEVVCVDDEPIWGEDGVTLSILVLGARYTVTGNGFIGYRPNEVRPEPTSLVTLAEVANPLHPAGWRATRFRPIVSLPECLTELLRTPKRESEPA